jgi:hypothetical protein
MLDDLFYENPDISCDIRGWADHAPLFSSRWHTPLSESTKDQFYLLVCNTFHNHPRRDALSEYWD